MFSYNDYLKECMNKSPNIKETEIYTKILADSKRVTAIFGGGELNVCGEIFILKDQLKVNHRFPMADKIAHIQKMCNHCSSTYQLEFMQIFDEVIAIEEYIVKKNVEKSSVW